MGKTLSAILIDVNAYIDLDAVEPTSTELTTRTNYAHQSVWNASAVAQFSEFQNIYMTNPGTLASISLPTDFRELMGVVHQNLGTGLASSDQFEEIKPNERWSKQSGDKYLYVLGNPSSGYTAVFNGLTANCTLSFDYQRFPSGLANLTDVCELPDPMYVVKSVEADVLESRNNQRFPLVRAEANTRLNNMIGREMKQPGGGLNQTRRQGAASYSIGS